MKTLWTGAVSLGLVNIPVNIYSATESSSLDLKMLDKNDHSGIRYVRINERNGKEVPWENIVKGYKMPNDEYVVLNKKDFELASAKKTMTIELTDFVNESDIDSIYFETPYYLEPVKQGVHAYALLREALEKTKKAGVASFVMRNKETLAILRTRGKVIVLNRIRFEEEIRNPDILNLPDKAGMKANELKMAVSLIQENSGKFDISRYKDNYTAELLKLIHAKAKGIEPKGPSMKIVHSKKEDLMEQLKASLNKKLRRA